MNFHWNVLCVWNWSALYPVFYFSWTWSKPWFRFPDKASLIGTLSRKCITNTLSVFFFVKHNRISPNRNYNNSTFYSRCTWKCRVSVGSNELTLPHENSECATEWAIFIQHLLIQHVRRNLSSIKITPILLNIIWPGRSETRSPNLVTPFATRKSFPILYLGRIFRRTMDHLELFDGLTGRNKTESREIKCFLFCTRTCEILILCSNGASKNRACSISINHVRSDPFHRRFL